MCSVDRSKACWLRTDCLIACDLHRYEEPSGYAKAFQQRSIHEHIHRLCQYQKSHIGLGSSSPHVNRLVRKLVFSVRGGSVDMLAINSRRRCSIRAKMLCHAGCFILRLLPCLFGTVINIKQGYVVYRTIEFLVLDSVYMFVAIGPASCAGTISHTLAQAVLRHMYAVWYG